MMMKTFVLTAMLFASVSASSFRRTKMQVVDSSTKSWNCSIVDNTCKCPESCMIQKTGESYCVLKDCYKYDENLGLCAQDGYHYGGPLALQAIPMTGVFGAGYGNIGRWDVFGMYMGITIGGCCFILATLCACLFVCPEGKDDTESKETGLLVWSKCGYCLWGVAVLVFYVIGIVQMATPGLVIDGNGCPLIF